MEILLLITLYVVFFAISVAILRWAFRINDIVTRLEHISMSNQDIVKALRDVRTSINKTNNLSQQNKNETETTKET
jgi:hypothetical protein